jgi:hypothetical protein
MCLLKCSRLANIFEHTGHVRLLFFDELPVPVPVVRLLFFDELPVPVPVVRLLFFDELPVPVPVLPDCLKISLN